jgi:hypothetical protein
VLLILGWATVLLFIFLSVLGALPEYIARIDQEILKKHRKPVPAPPEPVKEYPKPKIVK